MCSIFEYWLIIIRYLTSGVRSGDLGSYAIFIYISYDLFTLICVIIALNNARFLLW